MNKYYCNGRGDFCEYDPCDCDSCIFWDGTGGQDVKNIFQLFFFYLKSLRRKLSGRL